jgi:hypothetical protein
MTGPKRLPAGGKSFKPPPRIGMVRSFTGSPAKPIKPLSGSLGPRYGVKR